MVMRPPASSHADAGEGLASKVQPASKRTPLVVAVSMAGILIVVSAASWVLFTAHGREAASLVSGKPTIEGPDDCRTALAMTTACRGENSGFQECHYHFRAEGLPDPRICTAFLAAADAPTPPHAPAVAAIPADAAARGVCAENDPSGWQRVACGDYRVDATMVCFACADASHPESAREIMQAFDRSCDSGVVLKSCNEALRSTAGL
jgi:hypothetical protein